MSDALRDFAELVLRGLERGSIKSKPIMEFDQDDAEPVVRSLADIAREALAAPTDATG